jgi:DNA polymerase III gamma/tau subunit
MGFLDEVRQETGRVYRRRIDEIKGLLSEQDYTDFMEALANPQISISAICRALKKRGVNAAESTIRGERHNLTEQGDSHDIS